LENRCGEKRTEAVKRKFTENPVPLPIEFKNALKLISIAQFIAVPKSGSYDDDEGQYLVEYLSKPVFSFISTVSSDSFNLDDVSLTLQSMFLPLKLTVYIILQGTVCSVWGRVLCYVKLAFILFLLMTVVAVLIL
jgi:hypothetical protein